MGLSWGCRLRVGVRLWGAHTGHCYGRTGWKSGPEFRRAGLGTQTNPKLTLPSPSRCVATLPDPISWVLLQLEGARHAMDSLEHERAALKRKVGQDNIPSFKSNKWSSWCIQLLFLTLRCFPTFLCLAAQGRGGSESTGQSLRPNPIQALAFTPLHLYQLT